jgi:hypothetical protein
MGLVHGLMQTDEYAHQVIKAASMRFLPPSEVDRRVEARMERQKAWMEAKEPLRLWSILDEAALRRMVGDADIMRNQYKRIVEMVDRPQVMFQVMPASAGAHPGMVGNFTVIGFPERFTPDVVYIESMNGALYVEDERDVHTYSLAFEQMRATALSPEDSLAMLEHLAGQ